MIATEVTGDAEKYVNGIENVDFTDYNANE